MSAEPLKNARHEKFAQAVASGMSATAAYTEAGYTAKDADVAGPRLLGNVGVSARILHLKNENAKASKLSREDIIHWLERIITGKPNEASADSDICETVMTKAGPFTTLCSKMAAVDRLAKLNGMNEPEKTEAKLVVEVRRI